MRKGIRKLIIAMLVLTLLASAAPAMAAEGDDGLSIFGNLGDKANGLSAAEVADTPAPTVTTGDLIALDDLGVSVRASSYTGVEQDEYDCVYFYAMAEGSIPYVMLKRYDFTADDFTDQFTDYMASNYSDLREAGRGTSSTGDKVYNMVIYNYSINGYFTLDRRLFIEMNGCTYMIATKETAELGLSLPDGFLDPIMDSLELITGDYDDYPLHVDSTHSLGPSLTVPDISADDPAPTGTSLPTVGNSTAPVSSVLGTPQKSGYDDVIEFDPAAAAYAGTWVQFEDGFKLYLPSDWSELQLNDDDRETGILYAAYDTSSDNSFAQVVVGWSTDTTVHSVDDMKRAFEETEGMDAEDTMLINGIPCASFSDPDDIYSGIVFFHPLEGEPYFISIVVGDYSANPDICKTILCSLSLAS